jgi:nitric oxide reductase subunit C
MYTQDPAFWRAGAISSTAVMFVVLIVLTVDSVDAIRPGGSHVPPYNVINQKIGYRFDSARNEDVPTIAGEDLLFKRHYTEAEAAGLLGRGKLVIQSRAWIVTPSSAMAPIMAPDLTKAWLDPIWTAWGPMYGAKRRDEAIVDFLMHPDRFPLEIESCPTWEFRKMKQKPWWRTSSGCQRWMPTAFRRAFFRPVHDRGRNGPGFFIEFLGRRKTAEGEREVKAQVID